jgi:GntR family transcriptional regulator, transcriptional repressor for pyruvate dehydrogenase complex
MRRSGAPRNDGVLGTVIPYIKLCDRAKGAHVSEPIHSEWKPLQRMRTHEQVVAAIETRLNDGTLRAGDRLPGERQLAEALGVGRGAVREALRILEAIGVVEAGTGSGPSSGSTIVKDSTAGMAMVLRIHLQLASFTADDLVEVRFMLERLACRRAAAIASSGELADLRSLVEQMRETHTTGSYHDLDAAFHVGIAQVSGNNLVAALMAALRETLRQAMVSAFERVEDPAKMMGTLTDEHAAIVDAIAAGNGDEAAELVGRHILGFYRAVGFGDLKWAG